MKEETIVAKNVIDDYILANSLKPHSVQILNKLILSCFTSFENTINILKKPKSEQKAIKESLRNSH